MTTGLEIEVQLVSVHIAPNRRFSLKHENLRLLDFKISRSDSAAKTAGFESQAVKSGRFAQGQTGSSRVASRL